MLTFLDDQDVLATVPEEMCDVSALEILEHEDAIFFLRVRTITGKHALIPLHEHEIVRAASVWRQNDTEPVYLLMGCTVVWTDTLSNRLSCVARWASDELLSELDFWDYMDVTGQ